MLATSAPTSAPQCPVCLGRAVRLDVYRHEWAGRTWCRWRCAACTHGFLDPLPGPADQAALFDGAYFAEGGEWAGGFFGGTDYAGAEAHLRAEACDILRHLPPPPGRLLDVGCAGGVFLDAARAAGYDVAGIELNPTMAAHARTRFGLDVRTGGIETFAANPFGAPFTVVTLLDALEHLPAPRGSLDRVRAWTAPCACCFVRGPLHADPIAHAKAWVRRAFRLEKVLPGAPIDAQAFTVRSLETLLAGVGITERTWVARTRGFGQVLGRWPA